MNSASRSPAGELLPDFSHSFSRMFPSAGVGMRRFGISENDLAIDFSEGNTPALVTRILEQCAVDPGGRLPAGFFRDLTAGRRLECLLAVAAGADGSPFRFPLHCIGCGQEIELELTLDDIAHQQRESDGIESIEVQIRGGPVLFRKPIGRDQERWAEMDFEDTGEALTTMIGTLAASAHVQELLDPDAIDRIDAAMNEADPLVNFHCSVRCAECGSLNDSFIDLCDVALAALSRMQKQLIVMVHKLASRYHWSEQEIFSVPHWRRETYLNLINAGR